MKLTTIGLLVAALLIPVSIGIIHIIPDTEEDIIMEWLSALEDSEIVFRDRMRIDLKKGSKITYPTRGNGKDFNVILQGAAQFEIMRGYRLTVEDRIIVKATAANFSIEEGNGTISVMVTNNQVTIITGHEQLIIHAMQRATYNLMTEQITVVDTRVKRT